MNFLLYFILSVMVYTHFGNNKLVKKYNKQCAHAATIPI